MKGVIMNGNNRVITQKYHILMTEVSDNGCCIIIHEIGASV